MKDSTMINLLLRVTAATGLGLERQVLTSQVEELLPAGWEKAIASSKPKQFELNGKVLLIISVPSYEDNSESVHVAFDGSQRCLTIQQGTFNVLTIDGDATGVSIFADKGEVTYDYYIGTY